MPVQRRYCFLFIYLILVLCRILPVRTISNNEVQLSTRSPDAHFLRGTETKQSSLKTLDNEVKRIRSKDSEDRAHSIETNIYTQTISLRPARRHHGSHHQHERTVQQNTRPREQLNLTTFNPQISPLPFTRSDNRRVKNSNDIKQNLIEYLKDFILPHKQEHIRKPNVISHELFKHGVRVADFEADFAKIHDKWLKQYNDNGKTQFDRKYDTFAEERYKELKINSLKQIDDKFNEIATTGLNTLTNNVMKQYHYILDKFPTAWRPMFEEKAKTQIADKFKTTVISLKSGFKENAQNQFDEQFKAFLDRYHQVLLKVYQLKYVDDFTTFSKTLHEDFSKRIKQEYDGKYFESSKVILGKLDDAFKDYWQSDGWHQYPNKYELETKFSEFSLHWDKYFEGGIVQELKQKLVKLIEVLSEVLIKDIPNQYVDEYQKQTTFTPDTTPSISITTPYTTRVSTYPTEVTTITISEPYTEKFPITFSDIPAEVTNQSSPHEFVDLTIRVKPQTPFISGNRPHPHDTKPVLKKLTTAVSPPTSKDKFIQFSRQHVFQYVQELERLFAHDFEKIRSAWYAVLKTKGNDHFAKLLQETKDPNFFKFGTEYLKMLNAKTQSLSEEGGTVIRGMLKEQFLSYPVFAILQNWEEHFNNELSLHWNDKILLYKYVYATDDKKRDPKFKELRQFIEQIQKRYNEKVNKDYIELVPSILNQTKHVFSDKCKAFHKDLYKYVSGKLNQAFEYVIKDPDEWLTRSARVLNSETFDQMFELQALGRKSAGRANNEINTFRLKYKL